jgi:hypothetical protein
MMRARSFVSPRRLERVGGAMRAALAAAQEPAQRTSEKGRGRVDIVRRDGLARDRRDGRDGRHGEGRRG